VPQRYVLRRESRRLYEILDGVEMRCEIKEKLQVRKQKTLSLHR